MKLYLSSYKLGDQAHVMREWAQTHKCNKIALIINAGDAYNVTAEERAAKRRRQQELLATVGFSAVIFDLRDYFGKPKELEKALAGFRAFFVVGGNTFVLRQAMKLSGFDKYLLSLKGKTEYFYGGWSAGICVLAQTLRGIDLVDDPKVNLYGIDTIWDGLGILEYTPVPHFQSDHPESAGATKTAAYMKKHEITHMTLRDGDVIVADY